MLFDDYQVQAARTDIRRNRVDTESLIIPVLGVASEAGSLNEVIKKYLRDDFARDRTRDQVAQEIGDILWYLANVATRFELSLSVLAKQNLVRVMDRYGDENRRSAIEATRILDDSYEDQERFPRKMTFLFEERSEADGRRYSQLSVMNAEPNMFPEGKLNNGSEKGVGFTIGDPLNDNAFDSDGYKYHDALHLAFMGVLGWSPVMRAILRLKRKSNAAVDEVEDGARARDVEEGLATYLFQRSRLHGDFQDPRFVDNETLDRVLDNTKELEVDLRPGWLWKEAIAKGFVAWKKLEENKGGYVNVNLDKQSAVFSKML